MDISNKTLAWLLIGSIVVSLLGTFSALNRLQQLGVTGAATGIAKVNISSTASIIFSVDTVDWGTGYVNTTTGGNNCTLYTDGTSNGDDCEGFSTVTQGLILENNGNQVVNVSIASDKDAAAFIGGSNPSPEFKWKFSENEQGSCTSQGSTGWTDWADVSTTAITLCNSFDYVDTNDTIKIDLYVLIPYTATPGERQATLTVTIEQ